ncbi:MAG: DUF4352 domain-containing protein [Ruminococcus sp.]
MKKKIVLIALVATFALGATACSSLRSNSSTSSESQITGTIETTEKATEAPTTEAPTIAEAVKPGNYIEKGNLKISLESAKQYDEIQQSEYYTAKPEDGKKYLVLFFEVENISSEEQYINMFYCKAYIDDYDIDQTTLLANSEGYDMLGGDLAAGKKLKGYVCYEVDPDWQKLEFEYKDGITSDSETYDFIVTPDDLS